MDRELFCPLDGKRLVKAKWQDGNSRQSLICPSNHLWDVRKHPYYQGIEFCPVKLSKCDCGEVIPSRDMRDVGGKSACPACFEMAKKAWRMDKEKSYARLEITPVRTTNGCSYHIYTSIEISPYPNPFMYGGKWGGGGAKDEQELQEAIKSFEQEAAELKENGMEKIEVIRHDEIAQEQVRLEAKPIAETKPITEPKIPLKAEPKVKQPSLL